MIEYKSFWIITLLFGIAARILNPGWYLYFIIFIGPIHLIIYNIALGRTLKRIKVGNRKEDKIIFYLLCITFVLSNLFFEDFGDNGSYCFFMQIQNPGIFIKQLWKWSIGINALLCVFGTCRPGIDIEKDKWEVTQKEIDDFNTNYEKNSDHIEDSKFTKLHFAAKTDDLKMADMIDYNFMCKSDFLTLEIKKKDDEIEVIVDRKSGKLSFIINAISFKI